VLAAVSADLSARLGHGSTGEITNG
jgi:hypothetical protein